MAAIAMETAKMLKKIEKHKNDHSRLIAKQKLMKLERNNIRKKERRRRIIRNGANTICLPNFVWGT
jgi:hypothetical protein